MLEKTIEKQLVKEVNNRGGFCLKFNSYSMSGVPDRIVLMKDGKVGFVEVKQKGKKLRELQKFRKKQLKYLGFKVYTLDDKEKIVEVVNEICST